MGARLGGGSEGLVANKWLRDVDEMLDEVRAAQQRSYDEQRERKIAEALRKGLPRLILSLPNGGEETIDLRLH
jgi:hypothetical protein